HELRARGKMVFQDWKLHDIGAQVEGAARAVAEGGCDLLTVHAEPQVMRGAVRGRDAAGSGTKLLAVTVLTSLSDADLTEIGYGAGAAELVERRVRQALDCGVDGVVSSPLEAARVRAIAEAAGRPDFLVVTPGVRPEGAERGDQQRGATPADALRAAGSHQAVARPVLAAADPLAGAAGRPGFLGAPPGVRPGGAERGDQQRVATPADALRAGASQLVVARPVVAAADPLAAATDIAAQIVGVGR